MILRRYINVMHMQDEIRGLAWRRDFLHREIEELRRGFHFGYNVLETQEAGEKVGGIRLLKSFHMAVAWKLFLLSSSDS